MKKISLAKKNSYVNLIFIFIIKIYQKFISPLLPANTCRFYPSCSNYALTSFKYYSFPKAFIKSVYRVLRCNPWNRGGYDPVFKQVKIKKKENIDG